MPTFWTRSAVGPVVAVVIAIVIGVAAGPAAAAVAPNDDYTDRVPLVLGGPAAFDSTAATREPIDDEVFALCRGAGVDNTIWYDVVAPPAPLGGIEVSVTADHVVGIVVVTGAPGAFTYAGCGAGSVTFAVAPGVTYHVVLYDQDSPVPAGGTGTVVAAEVAPASVSLAVDRVGTVDRSGQAVITGTARCAGDSAYTSGRLTSARRAVSGPFAVDVTCDGRRRRWRAVVIADAGRFAPGTATVALSGYACNAVGCSHARVDASVRLFAVAR